MCQMQERKGKAFSSYPTPHTFHFIHATFQSCFSFLSKKPGKEDTELRISFKYILLLKDSRAQYLNDTIVYRKGNEDRAMIRMRW